ncbi:Gfo/Idh/MocA family oxidoreductase [Nocardioides humilatus]|uniref:Gfo/Idh/MocA family oxidoreductase n=1 Tax=Nocardioides humilatus TaxID=2607660 RepID=A0A5B1L9I3_9ACTN|nr:Gfo/Idh/MocA family oxidoreductase [Nocardioides humilatus]KAA1416878.1 Gfo/Idh/MocA family oxidoreductase [Nocardioides humilatus]
MRFGLIGTGPWADKVHGPALARLDGVDLVGLWGRSPERASMLASKLGVPAYPDVDALIADVEAVAFAVPPGVQAELAARAARAGRHLLLEKPVATDPDRARSLRDAVDGSGVSSVVFFTDRFIGSQQAWFAEVQRTGGWRGGWLRWFSALHTDGNPFGASQWRQEQGALWDIGPHAVSTLSAALGPIESVRASGGPADLVILTFAHAGGATSTATLSVFAPPAAAGFDAAVWGDAGVLPMPPRPEGALHDAFGEAVRELVAAAASGAPHPLGIDFGVQVVELLADAAGQLADGC